MFITNLLSKQRLILPIIFAAFLSSSPLAIATGDSSGSHRSGSHSKASHSSVSHSSQPKSRTPPAQHTTAQATHHNSSYAQGV